MPGETAVLVGGVVAGQGEISIVTLIALVWTCAVAGDCTSYTLGRRLGRGFLERHGPRLKITEERLQTVEGFFDRHGGPTILIGRFIGLVRALAPFIAGASKMELRRFLAYDVVGAGLWSALFCLLGYFFWQSLGTVEKYVGAGAAAFTGLVVVVLAIVFAVRTAARSRAARARAAAARRQPAVAARARPARLRLGPPHAGPARARADDAAGARRRRAVHVLLARVAARHAPARSGSTTAPSRSPTRSTCRSPTTSSASSRTSARCR